jgi:hypothetical protein
MNTATDASFWLFETPHTARRLNTFDSWIEANRPMFRCYEKYATGSTSAVG